MHIALQIARMVLNDQDNDFLEMMDDFNAVQNPDLVEDLPTLVETKSMLNEAAATEMKAYEKALEKSVGVPNESI